MKQGRGDWGGARELCKQMTGYVKRQLITKPSITIIDLGVRCIYRKLKTTYIVKTHPSPALHTHLFKGVSFHGGEYGVSVGAAHNVEEAVQHRHAHLTAGIEHGRQILPLARNGVVAEQVVEVTLAVCAPTDNIDEAQVLHYAHAAKGKERREEDKGEEVI